MKKILIMFTLIACIFILAACAFPGQNGEKPDGSGDATQNGDPNCKHGDSDGDWFIKTGGEDATCTKDGITDKVYCSECGYVKTEQKVIAAAGHKTVVIPAKEATCKAAGSTAGIKCNVCGEMLLAPVEIAQKNHSVVDTPSLAATCTSAGQEGGKHCSVCLTIIEEPTIIAPFGHDRGLAHIVVTEGYAPTCKSEGLSDNIYCTICKKDILTAKVIPVSEHKAEDLEVIEGYDATCTATGLTDGERCKFCDTVTIAQVEIPVDKNGHPENMIDTLARVEPLCYADGLTEGKHCNNCGITYLPQEAITERPAHDIDYDNPVAVALDPDCATHTDGYTAHYACKAAADGCDYEILPVTIKYEHTHGAWTTTIQAAEGVAGQEYTFCTECGEYIEKQIPALLPGGATPDEDTPDYIDPDGVV